MKIPSYKWTIKPIFIELNTDHVVELNELFLTNIISEHALRPLINHYPSTIVISYQHIPLPEFSEIEDAALKKISEQINRVDNECGNYLKQHRSVRINYGIRYSELVKCLSLFVEIELKTTLIKKKYKDEKNLKQWGNRFLVYWLYESIENPGSHILEYVRKVPEPHTIYSFFKKIIN